MASYTLTCWDFVLLVCWKRMLQFPYSVIMTITSVRKMCNAIAQQIVLTLISDTQCPQILDHTHTVSFITKHILCHHYHEQFLMDERMRKEKGRAWKPRSLQ
jgi:hypothetical protein